MKKNFPDGMDYSIVYDPTVFVRDSIKAVVHTLLEAVALVVLVVILFLQTWRASIIPLLAVPTSIVGTFAAMYLCGFSINALSLFGLVLAIGIVVDDAIVVVENVERNIEAGLHPREATMQAMSEVTGPIIAIALVLCAVFVPIAFISGLTGEFYRQFALTIAFSTIISAFNSLTLSPALSALLLKGHDAPKDCLGARHGQSARALLPPLQPRVPVAGSSGYGRGVRNLLSHKSDAVGVYAVLLAATVFVFRAVPPGFVPLQDKQYLVSFAQLPQGATLERTEKVIREMSDIALKEPGVQSAVAFPGLSINGFINSPSAGIVFETLEAVRGAHDARPVGLCDFAEVAGQVRRHPRGRRSPSFRRRRSTGSARSPASSCRSRTAPTRAMPCSAGSWAMIQAKAAKTPELIGGVLQFQYRRAAALCPCRPHQGDATGCRGAGHFRHHADLSRLDLCQRLQPLRPHLRGDRAGRHAVPHPSRRYPAAAGPQCVGRRWCRSAPSSTSSRPPGRTVRCATTASAAPISTARRRRAISSGQAQAAITQILDDTLPKGMQYEWTDLTYQEILAGNTAILVFPICVLLVFLVLAAQYESLFLPLAIILIVPMCLFSAITGVWLTGGDNNVFTQIGLFVLVGLACKNAILIVEFARELEMQGRRPLEAAIEAARLRLRPILMTSFAFIMGVVPLVLSSGAGAEMRHAMGVAVFFGMLGVTFFGLFLTPVFYLLLRGLSGMKPIKQHGEKVTIAPEIHTV